LQFKERWQISARNRMIKIIPLDDLFMFPLNAGNHRSFSIITIDVTLRMYFLPLNSFML
jgi:hypothetical protein